MLAFIYVPVIQKELDVFRTTVWNSTRGRKQPEKELPTGIPDFIYENPEQYGYEECGYDISDEDLESVATGLDIFGGITDHFIPEESMLEYKALYPEIPAPADAADAYIELKRLTLT